MLKWTGSSERTVTFETQPAVDTVCHHCFVLPNEQYINIKTICRYCIYDKLLFIDAAIVN